MDNMKFKVHCYKQWFFTSWNMLSLCFLFSYSHLLCKKMSSFIHSYLCINRDKTNYIPTTMQYAIFLQTHNLVDLVQARRSNCYNAVEQLYHFFVSIHDFWQQLLIPYCLFALCMKDQNSVCKTVNKGPSIRKF